MKSIAIAACLLVSAALAQPAGADDATAGRAVFEASCAKCHSLDPTAPGFRGPHLAELFDRRYGAVESFPYRMVWVDANPLWTKEHLNSYLEIHHLPDTGQRDSLIEFLFEATRK